jgi:hypothetical protein
MSFRPENEVQSHFEAFALVLDSALAIARPLLAADYVTVYDHSNRTGFDKSGMGNPVWEYEFERRQEAGSFIAKSVVRVRYIESTVQDVPYRLDSSWVAEVFQLGSLPTFRKEGQRSLTLDPLRETGLLNLVKELLSAAENSFPSAIRITGLLPTGSAGR